MKKLLILFLTGLICLSLVGCGGDTTATSNSSSQSKEVKLTDDDLKVLNEEWDLWFAGDYKEYKDASVEFSVDNKDLIMKIVIPKSKMMDVLDVDTSVDLQKSLRNTLCFDDFFDGVKEKLGDKFRCLQIYLYENEEDKNNDRNYQNTLRT